jgi:hypothetical protein
MASNSWSSSCCDGFVQPSFLWEFSVTVVCVTVFFVLVQNLLCIANWQEMWISTSYPFCVAALQVIVVLNSFHYCAGYCGESREEWHSRHWQEEVGLSFLFPILLIPPEVETEHVWFLSDALQHMDTVTECYMGVCLYHSLVAWYHNGNLHWDIRR